MQITDFGATLPLRRNEPGELGHAATGGGGRHCCCRAQADSTSCTRDETAGHAATAGGGQLLHACAGKNVAQIPVTNGADSDTNSADSDDWIVDAAAEVASPNLAEAAVAAFFCFLPQVPMI